jgi:hypothetical protein
VFSYWSLILDQEAYFNGSLPLMDASFKDTAACFQYFEPAQILEGFVGPSNGGFHSIFDAFVGGAGEFYLLIDFGFHKDGWRESKPGSRFESTNDRPTLCQLTTMLRKPGVPSLWGETLTP